MGYSTDFEGLLELSRPLTAKEKTYINAFADSRRMTFDPHKLMNTYKGKYGHPTPKDDTPEGIYGKNGEYYVGPEINFSLDPHVIDYNLPPGQPRRLEGEEWGEYWKRRDQAKKDNIGQPGLWCDWIITDDLTQNDVLMWNGGEKFYDYTKWLKYLIDEFFEPWGVKLNGEIEWRGDDPNDLGKIVVTDNVVVEKKGRVTYE